MPSKYQYRITLNDRAGEAVSQIAKVTGKSSPKIIREWLEEATEGLVILAEALTAAHQLQGAVRRDYAEGFNEAAKQAEGLQRDLFDLVRQLEKEAAEDIETGSARDRATRRGQGAGAGGPPACNTGVHNGKIENKREQEGNIKC